MEGRAQGTFRYALVIDETFPIAVLLATVKSVRVCPLLSVPKLTIFSSFQEKPIFSLSTTISNACVGDEDEADLMIC